MLGEQEPATRSQHPVDFSQSRRWIRNGAQREGADNIVERVRIEGQCLGSYRVQLHGHGDALQTRAAAPTHVRIGLDTVDTNDPLSVVSKVQPRADAHLEHAPPSERHDARAKPRQRTHRSIEYRRKKWVAFRTSHTAKIASLHSLDDKR